MPRAGVYTRGMRRLLLVVLVVALAGCSGSEEVTGNGPTAALRCTTPTDPNPTLGTPFNVRAGDQTTLTSERLTLAFTQMTEDSRCPTPIMCLVAGSVTVGIDADRPPDMGGTFALSIGDGGSATVTYAGYDVRLVGVSPYPEVGRPPTPPDDYCVQLTVVTH